MTMTSLMRLSTSMGLAALASPAGPGRPFFL